MFRVIYVIPKKEGGETMKRITKIEPVNKKANKKLKVAAYARVSTNRDDQLISLDV